MKKTLVIGASENEERYSNRAIRMLLEHKHPVTALGLRTGNVSGVKIHTDYSDEFEGVDTITLYLSPKNQESYFSLIERLNPKRIIFNPGTEFPQMYRRFQEQGIMCEEACTLVLLSLGSY